MTRITDAEHEAIQRASRALRRFQEATQRNTPSQLVEVFVLVAVEEGQTLGELTRKLGAKPTTASRQLLDLGRYNRRGQPGYGLIDALPHPLNRGANSYVLTAKGRQVAREIDAIMSGRAVGDAEGTQGPNASSASA